MFADVGRAKKARVVQKDALQQLSHVDADAELAFVRFKHCEDSSAMHAKRRMAEADGFFGVG